MEKKRRIWIFLLVAGLILAGLRMDVRAETTAPPESTAPAESTEPTEFTEPTAPAVPTESAEPTAPSEPTEFTEPTAPAVPTESTEPTAPAVPTESTEPTAPSEPTESTEPTAPTEPTETAENPEETGSRLPGLYFGLLHAHSTQSDGASSPEEMLAAAPGNMDFLALTDHSDSLTEEEWEGARTAARQFSGTDFVALRGYEMSWPEGMHLGHISVFGTSTFAVWQEDAYNSYKDGLQNFYAALASGPDGFAQFQHPGEFYGSFQNFAYDAAADQVISLLEVACEGETFYGAYTAALDMGWHVSPTFGGDTHGDPSASTGRTVVRMDTLTEENLVNALKNRRTYATEDPDLEILFTVNGFEMGEILSRRQVGPTAEIGITLHDPTDESIGRVEVVGPGNVVAAVLSADANPEYIALSLPSDRAYYYLRICQPDGDIAVTAPVWIHQTERVGIFSLKSNTAVVTQGSPVELELTLFNEASEALEVTALELCLDGETVRTWREPFPVHPGTEAKKKLTYTHTGLGQAELTLTVTATLGGAPRRYEETLLLSARRKEQVSEILVDAAHKNAGTENLSGLTRLAAERNLQLTRLQEPLSQARLENCALLILSSPAEDFSGEFCNTVRKFADAGGTILVCADDPAGAEALNRLLEAVGAHSSFGRALTEHRPREFDRTDPLCAAVNENQLYYMKRGCAVVGEDDAFLVKGQDTVMVRETLPGGGTLLVCGSLIASDIALAEPEYLWEEPYANRTILQSLLGDQPNPLALRTIRQAREGEAEEIYRVRGYVTASTFPETLFLQDKTGGIAVMPFREQTIGLGRAVEVTGVWQWHKGEPVLNPISVEALTQSGYRYQPRSLNGREAQNGDAYSGLLVQVTGICQDRTLREDGTLREFVLKDATGRIHVVVGDAIVSSATGQNSLHKVVTEGREIWAIGILQRDETGKTFLQVRNCEEVVAVAPNPYSGDTAALWLTAMGLSALMLLWLEKKRRACK